MRPPVKLTPFAPEEKALLASILRRRLFIVGGIYAGLITASIFFAVYFNMYSANFHILDNLEVINVVFAVVIALSGRLLVSEIIDYRKEIKSPDKKVIQTRILGVKDGKVTLGNKSFHEEDFLFSAEDFDTFKSGENVEIEISAKSDMLFRIKRI